MFIYLISIFFILILCLILLMLLMNKNLLIFQFKIVSLISFDLEFMLNYWNLMFISLVLLISLSVIFFSFSYMAHYNLINFMMLYMMFVFSMMWLLINNNFYWMMLGWDGLGVVSFLLIVYYNSYESISNGLFTIFQNRVGDLFFVLCLVMWFNLNIQMNISLVYGSIFLIIGSIVKSAQFPFNSWLLSAMSAPTPISSLVHSSTLVVAGVYILLEYSYCLYDYLFFLKFLSMLTLMVSTFGLMNESDMKKLIAYSTMNHVGLMMMMFSLGLYKLTFFHLNIHAMFKSMMFMSFGFVMLYSFHSQDNRLVSYMNLNPFIKMLYFYSVLCLMGLPFLTAFFSKDFIIEKTMEFSVEMMDVLFLLIFLSVSIYYSMKLFNLKMLLTSFNIIEFQILGMMSVFIMMIMSMLMINLYLSLIFSITLELLNFKMFIYLLMIMFLMLFFFKNFNFKWHMYDKNFLLAEIWYLNWFNLDIYFFSMINYLMVSVNLLMNMKLILLINWWVMVVMLLFF